MADRFFRLRHDRVVGGDDENDNVRNLSAARAHLRKGGVAGRVEESDLAIVAEIDLIGADMLGDAPGFARDDIRLAHGVKQRGLAVIDMAHDGHDRRARRHVFWRIGRLAKTFFHVRFSDPLDGVAEIFRNELGRVGVQNRVGGDHLALLHQFLDEIDGAHRHARGELLHGDGFRNGDVAQNTRAVAALLPGKLFAFARALDRSEGTLPLFVVESIRNCELAGTPTRRFLGL